ncbi:rpl12, partial [Symbiodinium microadriaticum]
HFGPLLEASQAYAQLSGCRFRISSFQGSEASGPPMEELSGDRRERLAARELAAPQVATFAERLQNREPCLLEELERAFRIVMVEGVRNAMIAAFQRLDLWPPQPPPPGIEDDDCCYEDVNSPVPVIAQRLYNDDVRRLLTVPCDGVQSPWLQRALTAAFIVDFATEVGLPSPEMPPTQQEMIEEFSLRIQEYESQCAAPSATSANGAEPEQHRLRPALEAFERALAPLKAESQRLREQGAESVGRFVAENKTAIALGAVGVVGGAVAAALAGGAIVAGRFVHRGNQEPPGSAETEQAEECLEHKSDSGRWLVRLDASAGEFAFKEGNLQLLSACAASPEGVSVLEGLDALLLQAEVTTARHFRSELAPCPHGPRADDRPSKDAELSSQATCEPQGDSHFEQPFGPEAAHAPLFFGPPPHAMAFAPATRRARPALALMMALAGLYALFCRSSAFVSGTPSLRSPGRSVAVSRESKVDDIVEELKGLTLLEASELVKAIEETFGVDASASAGAVVMAAPGAGGGEAEAAAEEKTEFDLILKEVPKEKKIAVIKAVRAITGLGLKEAKGLADNPGKILEAKPKEACEDALKQLEEAGAKAAIE